MEKRTVDTLSSGRGRWIWTAILLVLLVGVLFSWRLVEQRQSLMRQDLLRQAQAIAQTIDPEHVNILGADRVELDSPIFDRLNHHLAAVVSADNSYRFVYLMGRKPDGRVFFIAGHAAAVNPEANQ